MRRFALTLVLVLGCGEPAAIPGTQLRMALGAEDFWAAPFPSAHRVREDGRIDLSAFPNPGRIDFVREVRRIAAADSDGFGVSSAIFFPADGALLEELPSVHDSVRADASAFLMRVDGGGGVRHPVELAFTADGGPYGAPNVLSMLPLQGVPLAPNATYVAVVLRELGDVSGAPLGVPSSLRSILDGGRPDGMSGAAHDVYVRAVEGLERAGVDLEAIAGLAAFVTGDPSAGMTVLRDALLARPRPALEAPLAWVESYDDYCVYRSVVAMPVYQEGEPPYDGRGGHIPFEGGAPVHQRDERANVVVTIPRQPMPQGGFPSVLFIRTGGGGERPLVDRGARATNHGPAIAPGTGPARDFARAGFAGLSVDGPHGGLRNVTGGDEQLLIFNITNPVAMRDNLRQSAAELALFAAMIPELTVTTTACAGASEVARFDPERMALMGHSMGATIAPLVLAVEPRFRAAILSGAGGSWIENVIHKRSPLPIRPLAEIILDYDETGRALHAHDPVLTLLQWAGEPADPPIYAEAIMSEDPRHVLMLQGIVDTYILPPIANATSLSLGLDLAGDALEPSLSELLSLVGRGNIPLPARGNRGGTATAVVVQHAEDGIEDGHEVVFQTKAPKHEYRCFLETFARGGAPVVVRGEREDAPCPD